MRESTSGSNAGSVAANRATAYARGMSLASFLRELHEGGTAHVAEQPGAVSDEVEGALREMDHAAREEMAGAAPGLIIEAAGWAAVRVYDAARYLAFRQIEAEAVRRGMGESWGGPVDASVAYSVDLVMRVLPELIGLARGVADDDPLVEGLVRCAYDWPLSSVGVRGVEKVELDVVMGHPSLRRLYVDRVIAAKDMGPRATGPSRWRGGTAWYR